MGGLVGARGARRYLLRQPDPAAAARLFCLPYSGSGASSYHRWPRMIGSTEVCPVQLPGREARVRDPLFATYEDLADDLVTGLRPYFDRPFGLFGHCGSALACFEMAVRLCHGAGPAPTRLFVSSEVAPHQGPYGRFLTMDDQDLAAEVHKQLPEDPTPDFLALAVRVLRSDLEANRSYRRESPLRIDCPITALGWADDDEVPAHLMNGWAAYGPTTYRLVPGGHLDYLAAPAELLAAISADLPIGLGYAFDTQGKRT